MWSTGLYDLGLSSNTFWDLTYQEYLELMRRWVAHEKSRYRLAGIVAAAIRNVNMGPNSKPISSEAYIPKWPDIYEEDGDGDGGDGTHTPSHSGSSPSRPAQTGQHWRDQLAHIRNVQAQFNDLRRNKGKRTQ